MNIKFLLLLIGFLFAASWGYLKSSNLGLEKSKPQVYKAKTVDVTNKSTGNKRASIGKSKSNSPIRASVNLPNAKEAYQPSNLGGFYKNAPRSKSVNREPVKTVVLDTKENPYKQFMKASTKNANSLNSKLKNLSSSGLKEEQLIRKNEYFEKLSQQLKDLKGRNVVKPEALEQGANKEINLEANDTVRNEVIPDDLEEIGSNVTSEELDALEELELLEQAEGLNGQAIEDDFVDEQGFN